MSRGEIPEPQRTRLIAAAERAQRSSDELRLAVLDAGAAGGSVRDIAALSGKSTNTIQRWIREADSR